jgi:signal transduction histidine kinase
MPLADYFRSTPFRIASTYAGLFALSVAILFGVVFWLATEEMKGELRALIEQDIQSLLADHRERGVAGLREAVKERIAEARDKESFYMFQDQHGVLPSGNAPEHEPIAGWQVSRVKLASSARDEDGETDDFLARGIRIGGAFLVVGRSLHGVQEVQEVLLSSLGWALGLTALLALAGGIGLGHSALRRIDAINRTFQDIKEGNLARRVPSRGTRDELDRLVLNINDMLDRVELLISNLQQVTNDIAHDLRTPLGRLRQGLESARRRGSSVDDYRTAIDRAIEQTDTILGTFAALLRIAQIESGTRRGRFAAVDLSEISNRIVEAYETVAEDAGQSLSGDIEPGVQVRGDRDLLTQMLANLVENATRHCPAGAQVVITLKRDTGAVLAVADTGPGIPDEAREAVLRRFHRLEGSRTTPGSGLGLALVKAIADLHNATLSLSDNRPGLRVTLEFSIGTDH